MSSNTDQLSPSRPNYDSKDDSISDSKEARELEQLKAEIKKRAQELEEKIDQIIKALDKHHNHVNVAKVTGSLLAGLGGAVALVGALLAPATGGASLAVAGLASIASAAGGTISFGASIAEVVITRDYLQTADRCMGVLQDKIRNYEELAKNLARKGVDFSFVTGYTECSLAVSAANQSGGKLGELIKAAVGSNDTVTKTAGKVTEAAAASASVARSGAAGVKVAGKAAVGTGRSAASASKAAAKVTKFSSTTKTTGQTVAKGFGKGFVVLNAILIPVSIYDMYQAAKELNAGQGSSACPGLILLKKKLGKIARGNF